MLRNKGNIGSDMSSGHREHGGTLPQRAIYMDPFQQLPVELVLCILHDTGDFLGVDSLLQVSPCVHAIFQSNFLQTIKHLLTSCPTTAHELHHLFHITALIHTPSFNPVNFEDLATAISTACNGTSLNKDTARLMISIAAQIQHLACACLSTGWDNFQTAHRAILPEEWQRRCEPFSWIEEFRVHRALWQLRIYSDLWNIAAEKKSPVPDPYPSACTSLRKWTWSPSEADKITTLAIFDLSPVQSYEIHTVADLLRQLGVPSLCDDETPTIDGTGSGSSHLIPPPLPLFASLHVPDMNITRYLTWPSPTTPEETALNFHWGRSPDCTSGASKQATYYGTMQMDLAFPPGLHPTGLDDIQPFYRLGVFVWDTWRMYLMGCLSMGRPPWIKEMIQTPDGSYVCSLHVGMMVLEKRWCALVGRKTGGSKWRRECMEVTRLF